MEVDWFVAGSVDELLRTADLIVWDESEAEDPVLREFSSGSPSGGLESARWSTPRACARRVIVNLALDGRARRARWRRELNAQTADDRADDAAAEDVSRVDARDEVLSALSTLVSRQRAVLVVRYFADLLEAEIAAALGCSVGAVMSSASRGLE